jgi:hypothetical protein
MDRAEMIALASPPCRQCGEPVQRIEQRWHLDGDGEWRLGPTFMVCAEGHRTWMEALDE